jgi:hypothetical protein
VPRETRLAVRDEALAYGRTLRRNDMIALLRSVQDPEGRIAALVWLRQLPGKPSFFDHAYHTTREQRRP